VGTVSIGGGRFTGQAMVSEAAGSLDYYINGQKTEYEDFQTVWLQEFPGQPVPRQPFYAAGKTHIFTITLPFKIPPELEEIKRRVKEVTPLEAGLISIEARLKEALDDEEKAVPFYRGLKNEIEITINSLSPGDMTRKNVLASILFITDGILKDENRHRDRIRSIITSIQDIRKKE